MIYLNDNEAALFKSLLTSHRGQIRAKGSSGLSQQEIDALSAKLNARSEQHVSAADIFKGVAARQRLTAL